jgi:hypothetical protein
MARLDRFAAGSARCAVIGREFSIGWWPPLATETALQERYRS